MKATAATLWILFPLWLGVGTAGAAIIANPTAVNINSSGPTTFVVRYFENDPARTFTTTSALFCTDPSCRPGTIIGTLPPGLDRGSTRTPTRSITDVVTVPYSVIRRAVAQGVGVIFYVRTFQITTPPIRVGAPPGSLIATAVTRMRLAGGVASVPLSLTRVDIFGEEPERFRVRFVTLDADNIERGTVKAEVQFVGTGLLKGWWEVRTPADPPVRILDRFTEASLSEADRLRQRRFRRVKRIRRQLPPSGRITLIGPRYDELPSSIPGAYQVLLHIEVSRDPRSRSTIVVPGESRDVFSGASAGFPLPTLVYRVGTLLGRLGERELAARIVVEEGPGGEKRSALAWTPIKGRSLVIELKVTDRVSGEEHRLLAPIANGVVRVPEAWTDRRAPGDLSYSISVLDTARKPVANMEDIRLPSPVSGN